jgi:hypothetical protein
MSKRAMQPILCSQFEIIFKTPCIFSNKIKQRPNYKGASDVRWDQKVAPFFSKKMYAVMLKLKKRYLLHYAKKSKIAKI